ncbi:MAG: MFS transporter [Dehalococcoidia bacterium]|nr:MFS transporter [Dehalococcoidia bacterium]
MPYKWRALIAVGFGTFMATMDFNIINIALPEFAEVFDRPADTVVWAVLGSTLVVTGLTLTAGRAGDLFGRKRVYLIGWTVFTVGLTFASFAQSLEMIIGFRLIQSVGVAMAIANANAIVTEAFPDSERGRALGLITSIVGAGLMAGPILGGLILSVADWRAIFYLRIPIGFLAIGMAMLWVRESGRDGEDRGFDLLGAVTLFVALATVLLAVNRGPRWGWASPQVIGLLAVGVLAGVVFAQIELRAKSPILSLALFRVRRFAVSILTLVVNFAGQSAVIFLMPFYLLQVRDFSEARTGLILASVPLMMLLLSPTSGSIADRWHSRAQPALGIALISAGMFSLSTMDADTSTLGIVLRLSLIGVGGAVFGPPNASDIMGSVSRSMLGTASASVATSRNVGNAIGLAISSAVVIGVASSGLGPDGLSSSQLPPDLLLRGLRAAFLVSGVLTAAAVVISMFRGAAEPLPPMRVPLPTVPVSTLPTPLPAPNGAPGAPLDRDPTAVDARPRRD